jgi:hypothetical protein
VAPPGVVPESELSLVIQRAGCACGVRVRGCLPAYGQRGRQAKNQAKEKGD